MVADVVFAGFLFLFIFISLCAVNRWFGVDVFLNKSKMRRVNVKTPALDVVNVGNPFYIELGSQPFANGILECSRPITNL